MRWPPFPYYYLYTSILKCAHPANPRPASTFSAEKELNAVSPFFLIFFVISPFSKVHSCVRPADGGMKTRTIEASKKGKVRRQVLNGEEEIGDKQREKKKGLKNGKKAVDKGEGEVVI